LSDFSDDVAWLRLLKMDVFGVPMVETIKLLGDAKSSHRHLSEILLNDAESQEVLPGLESPLTNFVNLMNRVIEFSKNGTAGSVISRFLTDSGYLDDLSKEFNLENQQKIENLTKFSRAVWQFEKVAEDSSMVGLAGYLKLIEESKIPLSDESGADAGDVDAVQILTTHAAKGLEFDTVFIGNLVNGRFPILNKKDPLHIPIELTKEIFPEGDFHIEEERRLFYVALTRAKRNLVLSYSDKYAGPRKWKRSQFLDEVSESKLIKEKEGEKSSSNMSIASAPEYKSPITTAPKNWLGKKALSYSQIDTFQSCPLKYGYRYVLNVPTPSHHAANFGTSIHETLKNFYQVVMQDSSRATMDLMMEMYEENWISHGYEGKDHEHARKKQGKKMLEDFYLANSDPWVVPAFIERNFNLKIGDYMMNGRIDRIDKLDDGFYEVVDYKTGKSKTRLSKENKLQLYVYALACRDVFNIPVSKLSLHYLEDGEKLSLNLSKGYDELDSVREDVLGHIAQMKESDFTPTPGFLCSFCDYRLICPAV